jgi:hypothetical protein
VSKKIEEAKKAGWNLLIPSIPLTPVDGGMFVPALETVQISSDPKDKEVYPGSDKNAFRLHATALQRIAVAGGIKWMPELCGSVRSGNAIAYRAVGGVVKAEGDLYTEAGYYDQDPDILLDNLTEEYESKRSKWHGKDWWKKKSKAQQDDYIKACINRDFRQKRAYRLQLCETGAKNRVIRKIFNVKSEYTREELSKPFLILRYRIRLDYQDPVVRAAVVGGAIQAAFGVFGGGGGQPRQIAAPSMGIDPTEDPNLTGYQDPTDMVIDPEEPAPNGDTETMDSGLFDFENTDKNTQMNILRDMAKKAGFDSLGHAQKDARFNGLNRSQYFTTLRDMTKENDDDIPF